MPLHTVEPKTAEQLYNRLRETEKIAIRAASPDRLEYLRTNDFLSDGPVSPEAIQEVQDRLSREMAEFTARANWWENTVWAI